MVIRIALASPRIMSIAQKLCRLLSSQIFDPYRPEQHYMRGPGPKWREKHQPVAIEGAASRHAKPVGRPSTIDPGFPCGMSGPPRGR